MKEELVSLAKEKGFIGDYFLGYCFPLEDYDFNSLGINWYFWMCELQRWLREKHGIDITIALVATGYGFYIHKNRNYTNNGEHYDTLVPTYEEALEEGLKQSLNFIE